MKLKVPVSGTLRLFNIVFPRRYLCLDGGSSEYGGIGDTPGSSGMNPPGGVPAPGGSDQQGSAGGDPDAVGAPAPGPSITDLMKNPGKVVLCKVRVFASQKCPKHPPLGLVAKSRTLTRLS